MVNLEGDQGLGVIDSDVGVLEVDAVDENIQDPAEQELENEGDEDKNLDGEQDDGEESEEIEISIKGEEGNADDGDKEETPVIRTLRKQNREDKRRIKELERQHEESKHKPQESELGDKPTLESCDFDEDKFASASIDYREKEKVAQSKVRDQEQVLKAADDELRGNIDSYAEKRKTYKGNRFEEAESEVLSTLCGEMQNDILTFADNPHLLVNAIGLNPKLLERLSKIKDPKRFIKEITTIEKNLTVTRKKPTTKPEEKINGTSAALTEKSVDAKLDKLAAAAVKSGNMAELRAYRKKHKPK